MEGILPSDGGLGWVTGMCDHCNQCSTIHAFPAALKRDELGCFSIGCEKAEEFLRSFGIEIVRVRIHNDVARIELPEHEMATVLKHRQAVAERLKSLGFNFVSLDLEGFQSGSLNRVLPQNPARS